MATIVWSVSSYSNKINRVSDQVESLIANSVTQSELQQLQFQINELNEQVTTMDEIIQELCNEEE